MGNGLSTSQLLIKSGDFEVLRYFCGAVRFTSNKKAGKADMEIVGNDEARRMRYDGDLE
jgi:hypothetical protein